MSAPVRRDQFEISPKGITHLPTGAAYSPHPGAPHSGNMNPGQLGNVLPNGEDYRPHEVQAMMELLWAEYVDAILVFSRCTTRRPAAWCRPCNISAARYSRVLIRLTLSTFG